MDDDAIPMIDTWCGRPIDEMTADELRAALRTAVRWLNGGGVMLPRPATATRTSSSPSTPPR
jgi:hypothetical protein